MSPIHVIHQIQIGSEDLSLNIGRFVETLLCKYKLFLSAKIGDPLNRNTEIFQKPWIHLQISGVRRLLWSNSVQRSHISGVTFSLRSCVAIYDRWVWIDTHFYIEIFMLQISGAGRKQHNRTGDQVIRICTALSSMYFQKHWQYGILPLLRSGANLGSLFKVGTWIM
jgi:hypothetical protein